MQLHDEVELKWALQPDGYEALRERLVDLLGPARRLLQRNHFFDTDDRRLRRAGLNVRLREEDDRLLLTCKRRRDPIAGAHRHDEWEAPIDPSLLPAPAEPLDSAALPLPAPVREALAGATLMELGSFANLRLEHRDGADLLCLDRTEFVDGIDHELEIETSDPAAAAERWRRRLGTWQIAYVPQPLSKFARFLSRST